MLDSISVKDSLVDLYFRVLQSEGIYLLYELNKAAVMKIKTPFGYTDELQVDMILKQGTVNGPASAARLESFLILVLTIKQLSVKMRSKYHRLLSLTTCNRLADNTSKIVVLNAHAGVY